MINIDPFLLFVAFSLYSLASGRATPKAIELPASRFWQIVARIDRPLVVMTMKGYFPARLCYTLPYNGILFFTRSRPAELPEGVMIVPASEFPL